MSDDPDYAYWPPEDPRWDRIKTRAVVVLIDDRGRLEHHSIDAAIAREAIERHYRERRVY